ncbi:unnamed protein product [Echinostoma caproni]|uniref:Inhibitor_I29 domain-containing protein n=1 Tax=Echinostoma caproni TaxID=27848 RepID=A0A183BF97_9TREM|nr:unnamed protein product [Echinostoma caproni]
MVDVPADDSQLFERRMKDRYKNYEQFFADFRKYQFATCSSYYGYNSRKQLTPEQETQVYDIMQTFMQTRELRELASRKFGRHQAAMMFSPFACAGLEQINGPT